MKNVFVLAMMYGAFASALIFAGNEPSHTTTMLSMNTVDEVKTYSLVNDIFLKDTLAFVEPDLCQVVAQKSDIKDVHDTLLHCTCFDCTHDARLNSSMEVDSTSIGETSLDGLSNDGASIETLSSADSTSFPILFRGDLSPANAAYTITRPGVYKLTSAKTASGVPNISITANNVTLDLGGNVLTGGTNGIQILGNNVTVKNGAISGMTQNGVYVQGSGCRVEGLDVSVCATGITLQSCNQCVIDKCSVRDATQAGVSLVTSFTNYVHGCSVSGVQNFGDAYGFIAANGGTNVFDGCSVSDVRTTYTSALVDVAGWVTAESGGIMLRNEQGSSVLASKAYAVSADAQAKNVTYGIGTLPGSILMTADSLLSVTQSSYATHEVFSVAWLRKGDNTYLASGGIESPNRVKIYKFDVATSSLLSVTQSSYATNAVYSVAWFVQGDNIYLVSGEGNFTNPVKIYKFDPVASSLLPVTQGAYGTGNVYSVAWLRQGDVTYLAAGGTGTSNQIKIYKFEAATSSLLSVTQSSYGTDKLVWSVAWLRQGESTYLAAGGSDVSSQLKIYKFEAAASSLSQITQSSYTPRSVYSVAWLVQGKDIYIASGGITDFPDYNQVKICKFEAATSSLLPVTQGWYAGNYVNSVAWLTQGENTYLAAGGLTSSLSVKMYKFDPAVSNLLQVVETSNVQGNVKSVAWLSQEKDAYLASGSSEALHRVKIQRLDGFLQQESDHCLLYDNSVNGIHSTQQSLAIVGGVPVGTGLYLSTTDNYVANNTAYDCDFSFGGISSKYITSQADARGTYNIDSALTTPDKIEVMQSNQLPTIDNQVTSLPNTFSSLESAVDIPLAGAEIPVRSPSTLSSAGSYCLADTINGTLSITGTGITVHMNEHTINGGQLLISGDRVSVLNGTVRNNGAASGVRLTGDNCSLNNIRSLNNRTGFELNGADRSIITNCSAIGCTREGFLLNNSTRNYVADCEVQSLVGTGTLAGFKTSNGTSNTFKDCAVNGVAAMNGDTYGMWGVTERKSLFSGNSINDIAATAGNATGLQLEQNMWLKNTLGFTWEYYAPTYQLEYSPTWVSVRPGLAYLAFVANSTATPLLTIFRYDYRGFNLCYTMNLPGNGIAVEWLQAYGNIYLAASWASTSAETHVYLFDTKSEQLLKLPNATHFYSSTASYDPANIAWLKLSDGRIFLGLVGYSATAGYYNIQLLSFDGNYLTYVTRQTLGSTTVNGIDWLVTGSRVFLAVALNATTDTASIYEYDLEKNSLEFLNSYNSISGVGSGVCWLYYNGSYYLALVLNTATDLTEVRVLSFNPVTYALTFPSGSGAEVNTNARGPDWLITGTSVYLAFSTFSTTAEVNVYKFDPQVPSLTSYYVANLTDAYASYGVQWFTGVQGRAMLAAGFACTRSSPNFLAVKIFGFDLIGTTSSEVLDMAVSNVNGTGINVNQLSDAILNSSVSNTITPYREYPGWYDPSNRTIFG